MSYDEALAARIRDALAGRPDISERHMFGGVAFLLDGKMVCGVAGADMMLRVGPDAYEVVLARPHVRVMDFTGRPLRGYVYVAPAGLTTARSLRAWLERGLAFTATVKAPVKKRRPKPRSPAPRRPAGSR